MASGAACGGCADEMGANASETTTVEVKKRRPTMMHPPLTRVRKVGGPSDDPLRDYEYQVISDRRWFNDPADGAESEIFASRLLSGHSLP